MKDNRKIENNKKSSASRRVPIRKHFYNVFLFWDILAVRLKKPIKSIKYVFLSRHYIAELYFLEE